MSIQPGYMVPPGWRLESCAWVVPDDAPVQPVQPSDVAVDPEAVSGASQVLECWRVAYRETYIPGVYASISAAVAAIDFEPLDHKALLRLSDRVNVRERRLINGEDVWEAYAAVQYTSELKFVFAALSAVGVLMVAIAVLAGGS